MAGGLPCLSAVSGVRWRIIQNLVNPINNRFQREWLLKKLQPLSSVSISFECADTNRTLRLG